jgi:nitrogen regulatory protein P-II 2
MTSTERQLVTIIAEAVLEHRLLEEITTIGATGYSLSHARGKGTRGHHSSDWEGPNVRIETVVSADVAERIMQRLADKFFPNYSIVAYCTTVRVMRAQKFS